jgi:hypothetical protein
MMKYAKAENLYSVYEEFRYIHMYILQSLSMWNSTNNASKNCPSYISRNNTFQLLNCMEKLSFYARLVFLLIEQDSKIEIPNVFR